MEKAIETFNQKLTRYAREAMLDAQKIAQETCTKTVTEKHLLYAISKQKKSAGSHMLSTIGITSKIITTCVQKKSKKTIKTTKPKLSASLRKTIIHAYTIAGKSQQSYVGTEHIIHAILNKKDKIIAKIIDTAQKKQAQQQPQSLQSIMQFLDEQNPFDEEDEQSALEYFCKNLTDEKTIKKQTLIGRDEVLQSIITTLSRKEKSNPLLIGAPGVGKTAIIEGLAARILSGDVPAHLLHTRILTLDLAHLVAGATFRGEFESRLKEIITEVESNQKTILFIDEIHTIIGAGNASGTLDAANILKPALSRGTIRLIGATTTAEYTKHIEKDAALVRRMQTIHIEEPSRNETIAIINGTRFHYEKFHNITITPQQTTQLVDWSIRYLPSRQLPDKSLDILDEASAIAKLSQQNDKITKKRFLLEKQRHDVKKEKVYAVSNDRYDDALILRTQEEKLIKEIDSLQKKEKKQKIQNLTKEHIAQAVATLAHIPIHKITHTTPKSIVKTLQDWQKKVIGQKEATEKIIKTLQRSMSGLAPKERPIGSFLFLGPSGVGKTLSATTLSQTLFEDKDALIRIDMSELGERHAVAKLLGAPAGYIGHGEGGTLTEKIRHNPHSIVLFDEIEKAHPDTLNILLQILEDGVLTDASGQTANFRHAIIIMTSNIGTQALTKSSKIGFEKKTKKDTTNATSFKQTKKHVLKELRERIKPEILNRLDNIIVFAPLSTIALTNITKKELTILRQTLAEIDVKLTLTPTIARIIAQKTTKNNTADGARGIRNVIRRHLEDPIATLLLENTKRPLHLQVNVKNAKIIVQKK